MDALDAQQPSPSRPQSPRNLNLQPTNTLAGPSSLPDQPAPPIFLCPLPVYPTLRPHFNGTQDLLARFQLTPVYDKYVRPYSLPVDAAQPSTPGVIDKGKGKEKEIPVFVMASPAAETPGAGDDGEGDDNQGKVGKKWKNNYKHLIKNIPGKHLTKKDDHLVTTMQVPPKQRIAIKPFDLKTQREAFSVSLEGIAKWNVISLIGDSPQAKEEKRRKKELRKLAKAQGTLPPGVGTPGAQGQPATPTPLAVAGTPSAWGQVSSAPAVRTGTPRPAMSTSRSTVPPPGQARPSEHVPPGGAGALSQRPAPASGMSYASPAAQMPQTPATPAATPGAAAPADPKRPLKREREESVLPPADGPGHGSGIAVNTNGATRPPSMVLNAKAGTGNIRPRPVKKQRMDMQGHAREVPIQQPTPHA